MIEIEEKDNDCHFQSYQKDCAIISLSSQQVGLQKTFLQCFGAQINVVWFLVLAKFQEISQTAQGFFLRGVEKLVVFFLILDKRRNGRYRIVEFHSFFQIFLLCAQFVVHLQDQSVESQGDYAGKLRIAVLLDDPIDDLDDFFEILMGFFLTGSHLFFILIFLLHELCLNNGFVLFLERCHRLLLQHSVRFRQRAVVHMFAQLSALETKGKEIVPGNAFEMILNQDHLHEFLKLWGDVIYLSIELQLLVLEDVDQPGDGAFLEGAKTESHLVDHHPQRPNICLNRVYLSSKHFWGHVNGGTKHGLSQVSLVLQTLAETEVTQLDPAVMHKNVGGFQVAVHDIVGCQDLEGLDQLFQVLDDFALREAAVLTNLLVQCPPIAKLVEEVEIVDGLEYLYEPDDVWGVDLGEDLYLVKGALLQFGVVLESLHVYHLHRHFLAVS